MADEKGKRNVCMDYLKNERITEVLIFLQANDEKAAQEVFNITAETIARYRREAKRRKLVLPIGQSEVISKILKNYTPKELKAIADGGRLVPGQTRVPIVDFEGERFRIGAMTDSHLGSIFTNVDYVYKAFEEFKKEKVDLITVAGDITDGLSKRDGHIYELTHIGFDAQKTHAIEVYSQAPAPTKMICGNHDRWYLKSNGALIVKDICDAIPHAEYLGQDEGDISLKGKAIARLWHGEDSSSYATSYRLQKVVEMFTGGEKPNLLLAGHTHKQIYMMERNVHCFGCGSIQKQSRWMRSKRRPAHVGFWIIDVWINKKGISKCQGCWYPFYA